MLRAFPLVEGQAVGAVEGVRAVFTAGQGRVVDIVALDHEGEPGNGHVALVVHNDLDLVVGQVQIGELQRLVVVAHIHGGGGGVATVLGHAGDGGGAPALAGDGGLVAAALHRGDGGIRTGPGHGGVAGIGGLQDGTGRAALIHAYADGVVLHMHAQHRLQHADLHRGLFAAAVRRRGGDGAAALLQAGDLAAVVHRGDLLIAALEGQGSVGGVGRGNLPEQLTGIPHVEGHVLVREGDLRHQLANLHRGGGTHIGIVLAPAGDDAGARGDRGHAALGVHRGHALVRGGPGDVLVVGRSGQHGSRQGLVGAHVHCNAGFLQGDGFRLLLHRHLEGGRAFGAVRRRGLDHSRALAHAGDHAVFIHRGSLLVAAGPGHSLDGGVLRRIRYAQGQRSADDGGLLRSGDLHFGHGLHHQQMILLCHFRVLPAGDGQVALAHGLGG